MLVLASLLNLPLELGDFGLPLLLLLQVLQVLCDHLVRDLHNFLLEFDVVLVNEFEILHSDLVLIWVEVLVQIIRIEQF